MHKSEFGRENYGRSKLMLLIRKGGTEIWAYPRFPLCPDFLSSRTPCSALMVLGTYILCP